MQTDPAIVLDVSRLISRRSRGAPTGIDRVELEAAEEVLAGGNAAFFYATRGKRSWFVPRDTIAELTETLRKRWNAGTVEGEEAARRLTDWLGASPLDLASPPAAAETVSVDRAHHPRAILRTRQAEAALKAAPQVIYRNVSHHHLDKPGFLEGLKERWQARVEIFWHDAIPLRFPEYSREGDAEKHRQRLRNMLAAADLITVNSRWTAQELAELAAAEELALPEVKVEPLEPKLPQGAPPLTGARRYFLSIGTIEPRKNHRLLLEAWRQLAAQRGTDTPALVLVGRRGWMSSDTFALLDRCPALKSHVLEVTDLPDAALASLIRSAQAVLMPSFAEGFGLPVAEAQLLGTRVLAADLDVYTEFAGDEVEFLSPLDGLGWLERIGQLAS